MTAALENAIPKISEPEPEGEWRVASQRLSLDSLILPKEVNNMCTMCAIMIVNDSTWCAHRANSALNKCIERTFSGDCK